MIKLRLPFRKKEAFPEEFVALDLGGRLLKVFLFKVEPRKTPSDSSEVPSDLVGVSRKATWSPRGKEEYVRLLGARKAPRGEAESDSIGPEEALKEIVEDLKSDFPDLPKAAVIGVSGPYTCAFTTVVRSSLTKSADEIVKQAREAALRQAERELRQNLGDPKLSLVELEAEVLEVKEVEKLELYLFTSFGEKNYLRDLEALARRAGLSLWGFSSLPFNLVGALSGEKELNALIFDIGGEKTEISLTFGGELMDTKSFWWDFSPAKTNPPLFLELWLNAVSDALGTFGEVKTFPAQIFLTGGGAAFPDLVERVRDFPWGRDHPFDSVPEVTVISKDKLVSVHAEGTGLDLPEDILPLSLGRVALRVREESEEAEEEEEKEEEEE